MIYILTFLREVLQHDKLWMRREPSVYYYIVKICLIFKLLTVIILLIFILVNKRVY